MEEPLEILRRYWGHEQFRPLQEEIIQSVLSGKDTLALLPTGGGKSVCFQVPALCQKGMALVISPLIALMKDQVERLNRMGIAAAFVNSSMSRRQVDEKLQRAMDGGYRFLYMAPERIPSEMFQLRLPKMPINVLAIDEAHCISQWGYDFRPAYLNISQIREIIPEVPVIALTASAPPQVQTDIQEKLEMHASKVFSQSFRRENLRYFVLEEENVVSRILNIVSRTKGTGIIYARTRKRTETLSRMLRQQEIAAVAYHGGMKYSERDRIQQEWIEGEHRVIVATNAFGMGIDKANVRFVIHYNLPLDLESYYQEAGRGGRDGQTALAIAFRNPIDIGEIRRWSIERYPSWDQIKRHYRLLCDFFRIPNTGQVDSIFPLDMSELVSVSQEKSLALYHSLRILHNEGLLSFQEDQDDYGYLQVLGSPNDVLIYKQQHPRRAALIDFILRTLGGEVYQAGLRFLPRSWAHKLGTTEEDILQGLERMQTHSLISYTPPTSTPSIRFRQPFHRISKQELNWDKYDFLRKQAAFRLREMLRYVEEKTECRSLMIQQYFGEKDGQVCGKCDVCIGRNKEGVSDQELKRLHQEILSYIRAHPGTTYRLVLQQLSVGNPSQRETVLRYLLDKKIVYVNRIGELQVN